MTQTIEVLLISIAPLFFAFITAIASALNSISQEKLQKVQEQPMAVKDLVFGACVIHGLLVARQMFGCRGLTQSYAFSEVQPNHAVEVILRSKAEGQEELSLNDLCQVLIQVSSLLN